MVALGLIDVAQTALLSMCSLRSVRLQISLQSSVRRCGCVGWGRELAEVWSWAEEAVCMDPLWLQAWRMNRWERHGARPAIPLHAPDVSRVTMWIWAPVFPLPWGHREPPHTQISSQGGTGWWRNPTDWAFIWEKLTSWNWRWLTL